MALWGDIEAAQTELRDQFRIKRNTDYSVMVKYNQVYVTCISLYQDTIRDAFTRYGVSVDKFFTI